MRGISPIIATVLMLAIAITAGIVLYAWFFSLQSSVQADSTEAVLSGSMGAAIHVTALDVGCAAGWVRWNGHCYRAFSTQTDWNSAYWYCSELNSHLVTVSSHAEENLVNSLVPNGFAWLGCFQPLDAPEPAGGWTLADGATATYFNWSPGEPNDYASSEDYCERWGPLAYAWNDADGTIDLNFLCEYLPLEFMVSNIGSSDVNIASATVVVSVHDVPLWAGQIDVPRAVDLNWTGSVYHLRTYPVVCNKVLLSSHTSALCKLVSIPAEENIWAGTIVKICVSMGVARGCDTVRIS